MPKPAFEPWEAQARARGHALIAGVDEAGRGPLAGPVVAAAVILPEDWQHPDLNDSKLLSSRVRDRVFSALMRDALAFGVGIVDARTIDSVNILQATFLAMGRAVSRLRCVPDLILIDGNQIIPGASAARQEAIVDGDARVRSIAAASVLAKVTRDRLMIYFDRDFPQYGFAKHKGYGTLEHRRALAAHGPSPLHRRSFAPVKALAAESA